eukprot:UN25800
MEYKCFYTMKKFSDDGKTRHCILGYGLLPKIMVKKSRRTGLKKPQLEQLIPSLDIISWEAYARENVRNNVWKDQPFTHFMPLYICKNSRVKGILNLAEQCILKIWEGTDEGNETSCTENLILNTLTKLMNTTVVGLIKSVQSLDTRGEIRLHDSKKALQGYMSFHHLLLAFVEKYPNIVQLAHERVGDFISNSLHRDKENTPELGEILIILSLTDFSWNDFMPHFMEETMHRNVRMILTKYPNLNNIEDYDILSCLRLRQSWDACKMGHCLVMFQRFFLENVARPTYVERNPAKLRVLLNEYNKTYGRPQGNITRMLQIYSRKVLAVKGWDDYFKIIGFPCPSAKNVCNWLRNSFKISAQRKYHSYRKILRYPATFRIKPDDISHMIEHNCICETIKGCYFRQHFGVNRVVINNKRDIELTEERLYKFWREP